MKMLRYSVEIERNFDVSRGAASFGASDFGSNGESANMGDVQPTTRVRTGPAAEGSDSIRESKALWRRRCRTMPEDVSEELGKRSKDVVCLRTRTLTRPEHIGLLE